MTSHMLGGQFWSAIAKGRYNQGPL